MKIQLYNTLPHMIPIENNLLIFLVIIFRLMLNVLRSQILK